MKKWLLILPIFISIQALAQEPDRPEIDLEDFVEMLFQIQDDDINYDDLYESLLLLYSSPLNINSATKEDLASLYVLNVTQINELIEYRQANGDFISIYELQSLPSFDEAVIRRLLPFVEIRSGDDFGMSGPLLKRILNEENNYLLLRMDRTLEEQRGFSPAENPDDTRFLGSP